MNALGDARFHARSEPQSLAAVAAAAHGTAPGTAHGSAPGSAPGSASGSASGSDPVSDRVFTGVAPLQVARLDEVSFLNDRRHLAALGTTGAGAVLIHPDLASHVPTGTVAILVAATYEAWARVARLFHPLPPTTPGVHPTAFVSPAATVDPSAEIGPFATIEDGAVIGPATRIAAYAHIGAGVVIGAHGRIGSHCTVSHALIGDRVTLSPGVRVGQEGYSFAHTPTGFLTIPQLGRVLIEDDVEVGANTTIDRGSVSDTVIGAGSRLDNLVQIGHNVRLGKCCVMVAQAGIAGSTVLEDFVQVGGQAAFANHLVIGRGAKVGAQAGVISDVAPGAVVMGFPAQPRNDFFRQVATLKRLARRPTKDS